MKVTKGKDVRGTPKVLRPAAILHQPRSATEHLLAMNARGLSLPLAFPRNVLQRGSAISPLIAPSLAANSSEHRSRSERLFSKACQSADSQ
jgi:hypothetical protein